MEKNAQINQIVFTGPECTGKTTLSKLISEYYNYPLVSEYARSYINNLKRPYNYNDLVEIAKGQINLENQAQNHNSKFIVCDTNLQVIKIYPLLSTTPCFAELINLS